MERLTEIKALIDTKRTTRLPKELNSQRLLGMLFVFVLLALRVALACCAAVVEGNIERIKHNAAPPGAWGKLIIERV